MLWENMLQDYTQQGVEESYFYKKQKSFKLI
jgi:hypothetical protein